MTNDESNLNDQAPMTNTECNEAAMAAIERWLLEVFRELSPQSRQEVLRLAEELAEEERLKRLLKDECGDVVGGDPLTHRCW